MKKFRLFLIVAAGLAHAQPYDLVIRNGHIIDGTGSPWYSGDIAIQDGRIAAIGQLGHAETKADIDAQGLAVAPGFIDMLGQSELTILVNPHLPSKIFQGITTEITGEGSSVAPLNQDRSARSRPNDDYDHYHITPDWTHFPPVLRAAGKAGDGDQSGELRGRYARCDGWCWATTIARRLPSELDRMKQLVREAMRDGAVGLSTSLQYAPAPYASTEELIALASEAAKTGRNLRHAHAQRRRCALLRRSMK